MARAKSLKAVNQTKAQSKPPKSRSNEAPSSTQNDFDESVVIRKLADNERSVREKALKTLAQFISTKRSIDSLKLQKLWKGLFFTVWHSDRPLTQQALVQELADLTNVVKENNYWKFMDAFWAIMTREWHTIDKHRIDKFYMLIRRVFAANLTKIAENNWSSFWVKNLQDQMTKYSFNPDDAKIPHALRLHMCDILLDEVDRVNEENSEEIPISQLLEPALKFVEDTHFKTVKLYAIENVFRDARLAEQYNFTSRFTPVTVVEEDSSDSDDFDKTSDEEEEEDSANEEADKGDEEEEEFTGFD